MARRTKIDCCTPDCPDRVADPNCHGYCKTYLTQREELDETMRAENEKKRIDSEVTGTLVEKYEKMSRYRHMRKKSGRG